MLFLVKFSSTRGSEETEKTSVITKLVIGFQVLYSYKYINRKAIISSIFNLTLTPAIAFLPLLGSDYYREGPELLAILQTTEGIGIAPGGLLMS